MKQYCVYITASTSRVLYIGATSNLQSRIWQHKHKVVKGFTKKYNVDKLVYFEQTEDVISALEREKQLKKWSRIKKIKLIEKINPNWKDLSEDL